MYSHISAVSLNAAQKPPGPLVLPIDIHDQAHPRFFPVHMPSRSMLEIQAMFQDLLSSDLKPPYCRNRSLPPVEDFLLEIREEPCLYGNVPLTCLIGFAGCV